MQRLGVFMVVSFFKKNRFFFLSLSVLGCVCFFPLWGQIHNSQLGLRIDVRNLHLYKMLHEMRASLIHMISADLVKKTENVWGDAVKGSVNPLELIEYEIRLLHEIVETFNNPTFSPVENQFKNLRIQYKFINLCNLLTSVEGIEPRHVRMLRNKIESFDKDVQRHCLRQKDFLNENEIALFNKITQFNRIMLLLLLKGEYLGIEFADKFVDVFYHRPKEWVSDHPWLTAGIIALVGFLAWHYYVGPKVMEWRLQNMNQLVDVKQLPVRNQLGRTCGVHAAHNVTCFMRGQNEEDVKRLLGDDAAYQATFAACARVNNQVTSNLTGAQVQRLLDASTISAEARANMMIIESNPSSSGRTNILDHLATLDPTVLAFSAADVPSLANLPGAPARFRAGHAQYFVVNDGGHWLPYKFETAPAALGGVKVTTGESNLNFNVTTQPAINRIYRFLTGSHGAVAAQR